MQTFEVNVDMHVKTDTVGSSSHFFYQTDLVFLSLKQHMLIKRITIEAEYTEISSDKCFNFENLMISSKYAA